MDFERVWENNSRSLSPKAKSTNYLPSEPRKVAKKLLGAVYVNLKSSRFWGSRDIIKTTLNYISTPSIISNITNISNIINISNIYKTVTVINDDRLADKHDPIEWLQSSNDSINIHA